VDDDAVSNRAIVIALGAANLRASSVADALGALKQLEQTSYDLVLLDIDLPGMDGIAVCEKMRSLPLHKRTPVIFVTGMTDFKTRARSILSGGDDLITKPVLPIELVVKAVTLLLKKTGAPSASPSARPPAAA
jgi:DNA-binding response OmpR family regulator